MKHIGLDNFLQKIEEDPANQILINRFFLLLKDFEDKNIQIKYLLKLVQILVDSDPKFAIEIAYAVYKSDDSQIAALELIAQGFKNLGRYAKAEVVLCEIDKLKQASTVVLPPKPEDTVSTKEEIAFKDMGLKEVVSVPISKDIESYEVNDSATDVKKSKSAEGVEDIKDIFQQIESDFVEKNKVLQEKYNTNLNDIFSIPFNKGVSQDYKLNDSLNPSEIESSNNNDQLLSVDQQSINQNHTETNEDDLKYFYVPYSSDNLSDKYIEQNKKKAEQQDEQVDVIEPITYINNAENECNNISDISAQMTEKDKAQNIHAPKESQQDQPMYSSLVDENLNIDVILDLGSNKADNSNNVNDVQKSNSFKIAQNDSFNKNSKSDVQALSIKVDKDNINKNHINIQSQPDNSASDNLKILEEENISDSIYNEKIDFEVMAEMFDFYWKHNLIEEAKKLLDKVAPIAKNSSWWKSRKIILNDYLTKNKK